MEVGDCLGCRLLKKNLALEETGQKSVLQSLARKFTGGMDFLNMQTLIDVHPSAPEVEKYSHLRNLHRSKSWNNAVPDWPTNASQITPDKHYDMLTPYAHVPALNSSGTYRSEFAWSGDQLVPQSATSVLHYWQNDVDTLNTSFFNQLQSSNAMTNFTQPYAPHYVSACTDVPAAVGEDPISCLVRRHHSVRKPIRGLAGRHVSASRTQSTAAGLRHTPYSLGHDSGTSGPSTVTCQWATCAIPCGETVVGTKRAVGQHLHVRHAIRLGPDMITCLWGDCGKPMRRESMARHILAVHIQDKVPCTGCGSDFARPDSLQRHQRTCLTKGRGKDTS